MRGTQQEMQFESGPLVAGALLVGVGGLLAFIGLVISITHALSQGVRWAGSLEHPPSEVAKTKWTQLKAAGSAGASAWKGSSPSSTAGQLN
jgi:hypothetical protein